MLSSLPAGAHHLSPSSQYRSVLKQLEIYSKMAMNVCIRICMYMNMYLKNVHVLMYVVVVSFLGVLQGIYTV